MDLGFGFDATPDDVKRVFGELEDLPGVLSIDTQDPLLIAAGLPRADLELSLSDWNINQVGSLVAEYGAGAVIVPGELSLAENIRLAESAGISCIIADLSGSGEMRVIGIGNAPSEGLRRGVVVDLEKTVGSIQRAVDEAEHMAGVSVKGVTAGIAGDHIRSINSRGVIAVSRRDNEISQADVDRVVEAD